MINNNLSIAIVGTFDSKGQEHLFLKNFIEQKNIKTMTVNVGTHKDCPFHADIDLYKELKKEKAIKDRDELIQHIIQLGRQTIQQLYNNNEICGIISAGGGTGTFLCTKIMQSLPIGIPKVMISTVASRDMSEIVSTKDIIMIHSVVDFLGLNSISKMILEKAAVSVCAMSENYRPLSSHNKRIALTLFGFITEAAENIKCILEKLGYEVIPFHANGTGGMAMEDMAGSGFFDGILDLATHEFADELMQGYCRGIGPDRLQPKTNYSIPRLVVPGGLDCAVKEFTRTNIPDEYKNRQIFYYDFRSGIRLNPDETKTLAHQIVDKLNQDHSNVQVVIPQKGWSEADYQGGPLYDPETNQIFLDVLKAELNKSIKVHSINSHINDVTFAQYVTELMDKMIKKSIN